MRLPELSLLALGLLVARATAQGSDFEYTPDVMNQSGLDNWTGEGPEPVCCDPNHPCVASFCNDEIVVTDRTPPGFPIPQFQVSCSNEQDIAGWCDELIEEETTDTAELETELETSNNNTTEENNDGTPAIYLWDGSAEVNGNGFCLTLPDDDGGCQYEPVVGSSCLSTKGTQFSYNDSVVVASNVTCMGGAFGCLSVEASPSVGSSVIIAECNTKSSSMHQSFTYTSSGKFMLTMEEDDSSNTTTLCLGMEEYVWQEGAPTPYVDPTFWRDLMLMECNATDHTLITWMVDPMPTNVMEDGPMPEELDYMDMDLNNMTTSEMNSTNATMGVPEDTVEDVVAGVSKTGNLRRILD